jgi:hypothetical protein
MGHLVESYKPNLQTQTLLNFLIEFQESERGDRGFDILQVMRHYNQESPMWY